MKGEVNLIRMSNNSLQIPSTPYTIFPIKKVTEMESMTKAHLADLQY